MMTEGRRYSAVELRVCYGYFTALCCKKFHPFTAGAILKYKKGEFFKVDDVPLVSKFYNSTFRDGKLELK